MNKEALEKYLKSIFTHQSTIDQLLSGDEIEDLDDFVSSESAQYLKSREDHTTATKLKDKVKEQAEEMIKNYDIKVKKLANKKLGFDFTNSEMDNIETLEDFYKEGAKKISKRESDLTTNASQKLKEDLEAYKTKYSKAQNELDSIRDGMDAYKSELEQEKTNFELSYQSKFRLNNVITSDKEVADVRGKDWQIKKIKEEILRDHVITDDDGTFTKLDGTQPVHPEKDVVMTNVSELWHYYKEKAGLLPVSNGGKKPLIKTATGKVVANNGEADEAVKKQLAKMEAARQNN